MKSQIALRREPIHEKFQLGSKSSANGQHTRMLCYSPAVPLDIRRIVFVICDDDYPSGQRSLALIQPPRLWMTMPPMVRVTPTSEQYLIILVCSFASFSFQE